MESGHQEARESAGNGRSLPWRLALLGGHAAGTGSRTVGSGGGTTSPAALWIWSARARLGNEDAQLKLADLYTEGRVAPVAGEEREALDWFRRAADQGVPDAQLEVARFYAEGRVVPRDEVEAARWYRAAADAGSADAQAPLGALYEAGRGVPRDDARAAEWYGKAAGQGSADAASTLAKLYADGRGVARGDPGEAARWYRKVAGDGWSQLELGERYDRGYGVPLAPELAVRSVREATEGGNAYAQYELGLRYAEADGVLRDRAAAWLRKAADQGLAQAQARLAAMPGSCRPAGAGESRS